MALELSIVGPGLDVRRVLQPGGPNVVLGRDADCDIRLPDPGRNVSRRHLVVWNEEDEMHFSVVSLSKGVEMLLGAVPPGAKGVLPCGQKLGLAGYSLTVAALHFAAGSEGDIQAPLDQQSSGRFNTRPPVTAHFATDFDSETSAGASQDDPFGDWGFETISHPVVAAAGPLDGLQAGATGDLSAFFKGLGLNSAQLGPLSKGELEIIGASVRTAVMGLIGLYRVSSAVKQELHAEDRTMIGALDHNPLKTDWPEQTQLQYLFGGRVASVGFVSPDRAIRELVNELRAHELAFGVATRATVEGTVREFAPSALKARSQIGGSKLFEGARAWEAYCRNYGEQEQAFPAWVQRLLDTYFADAYLRESLRVKRETPAGEC